MASKTHWERVYATRGTEHVSWFQANAGLSLALIESVGAGQAAPVIDVGGGASRLVDGLLDAGYTDVSVLDLSTTAIHAARGRLGPRADAVTWREADVLQAALPAHAYVIWHDRAVFHFLTDPAERRAYARIAYRALRPGGTLIVATFGEDGPATCSGLPVMRYNARTLHAEFGAGFALGAQRHESHQTPDGQTQRFVYCLCRRR